MYLPSYPDHAETRPIIQSSIGRLSTLNQRVDSADIRAIVCEEPEEKCWMVRSLIRHSPLVDIRCMYIFGRVRGRTNSVTCPEIVPYGHFSS